MKRFLLPAALLLFLCNSVNADANVPGDVRAVRVDAVGARRLPAMKYQLLFDNLSDRRPGQCGTPVHGRDLADRAGREGQRR